MKTLFRKICLSIFLLSMAAGNSSAQDLFDYSNSLRYANYLFSTGQFRLAATEFERVTFLNPNDTLSKLKLIRSYRFLKEYATAEKIIEASFSMNNVLMPKDFSYEYIKDLISESKYAKAEKILAECTTIDPDTRADFRLGLMIMENRWKEALSLIPLADSYNGNSLRSEKLNSLVVKKLSTPSKSPALAGIMSAIVPGSGKMYCGKMMDGIYSLVFIGCSTWMTSRSYSRNGVNFGTALLGSLTFSFYSANIYGSAKTAKKYNESLNVSYRKEAEDILLNEEQ
jgi:tetratricopeptide (TPR) repeat protein